MLCSARSSSSTTFCWAVVRAETASVSFDCRASISSVNYRKVHSEPPSPSVSRNHNTDTHNTHTIYTHTCTHTLSTGAGGRNGTLDCCVRKLTNEACNWSRSVVTARNASAAPSQHTPVSRERHEPLPSDTDRRDRCCTGPPSHRLSCYHIPRSTESEVRAASSRRNAASSSDCFCRAASIVARVLRSLSN